MNSNLYCL